MKKKPNYIPLREDTYLILLHMCDKLNKTREQVVQLALESLSEEVLLSEKNNKGVESLREILLRIESRIEDIADEVVL